MSSVIDSVVKVGRHSHIVEYDPRPTSTMSIGNFNWMLEVNTRGQQDLVEIDSKIIKLEIQMKQLREMKAKIEQVLIALA